MADYQIVCVNTQHSHRHITNVGTGNAASGYSRLWTVESVRAALDDGDTFYTVSPSRGTVAEVYPDDCPIDGCTVKTIRSRADKTADNNLDNLAGCALG
jgi:hypothetical protein